MRTRISQNFTLHNGKEVVRRSRQRTDFCTFCPANHNENANGSKSQWGRKVAAKKAYSSGKHRKEVKCWYKYWDLYDKHYEGMK